MKPALTLAVVSHGEVRHLDVFMTGSRLFYSTIHNSRVQLCLERAN
jgi:hypothetical protein